MEKINPKGKINLEKKIIIEVIKNTGQKEDQPISKKINRNNKKKQENPENPENQTDPRQKKLRRKK